MLFMLIITWEPETAVALRKRLADEGLLTVAGYKKINSWTSLAGHRAFYLLEVEDPRALLLFTSEWSDVAKFEVYSVMPGEEVIKVSALP